MFKNNLVYKSISRIFRLLPDSYKRKSVFQLVLMIVNSFVDLLGLAAVIPLLAALLKEGFIHEQRQLNWLYQTMGFSEDKWFIVFISILVMMMVIAKNTFGLWVNRRQVYFSGGIYEYLSERMFTSTYERGLEYFNNENSNRIQNRIVRVPQTLSAMITGGVFQFLNELIVLILIIISIVAYDPKIIGILLITIVPVFLVFYRFNREQIKNNTRRINDLVPKITKPVYELSFGYVDVAISGVITSFKKIFSGYVGKMKKEQAKLAVLNFLPSRLIELSVIGAVVLILLYGVFVLQNVEAIITLLGVFGLAAYRIVPSANRLMMALINIKGGEFTIDVMEKYLFDKQEVKSVANISFQDKIQVRDLSFCFPDAQDDLLKNINLEINKGEVIGLIGRSGSGKTTLMNILLGFINPSSGTITIDDTILNKLTKEAWQKLIGYVRQDVFLIDATISENIAFGVPKNDIDVEKLNEVIQIASLKSFVDEQEHGVDTLVGERGTKISGGQRQRIGIARALYHGAEVLFFDEATSALDEKTEQEITDAIENLSQHHLTIVIIAHRISSLKYCSVIYGIENGGIYPLDMNELLTDNKYKR